MAAPIPDLDQWLAAPALRTSHRRAAAVEPETLWRAALAVELGDCRLLGPLVRLRLGLPDTALTFAQLFRGPPLVVLDDGPTWALSGLCGRIWSARGVLGDVGDAQGFRDWDRPGTVRVLFAHWVERVSEGAALCSEVRVSPTDRRAALYLHALEPFIAAFQNLIGIEPLALAVRRAQSRP